MKAEVSAEELKLCLEAISRHPRGKDEVGVPADIFCADRPNEKTIWINFVRPSAIPIGQIYKTWIISMKGGKVDNVIYCRSKKGQSNDESLPAD